MDKAADEERQPLWFLLLLALAASGGAVAYVPFLTILLPVRISELAGTEDVAVLSYVTFAGAVAASLANILFGWLSDRTGRRRAWILAGLLLSSILLMLSHNARDAQELILYVIAWQLGLNMMLGPLMAWAGDCVPDTQKGLLGGLLAFAPALGALSGTLITFPGLADSEQRLQLVILLVVLMVSPVLLAGRSRGLPHLTRPIETVSNELVDRLKLGPSIRSMWFARLLVQIAEAALFAFLLFWLRSLAPDFKDYEAARIFSGVLILAVPIALLAGRWSDQTRKPMLPLAVCAGLSSCGLLGMALAGNLDLALGGYFLFGIASMTFLSLHASQTLRVLPRPQHRGRDLGFFNLTNTVPSLIIPGFTLALVPVFGFSGLFLLLALFSAAACVLLSTLSRSN
ncbi:MAG: MFS transporter [Alphaproteobacteria bacterium]|nr:MAG: MFS transporter [Alphaproteobacteria bacterium]